MAQKKAEPQRGSAAFDPFQDSLYCQFRSVQFGIVSVAFGIEALPLPQNLAVASSYLLATKLLK